MQSIEAERRYARLADSSLDIFTGDLVNANVMMGKHPIPLDIMNNGLAGYYSAQYPTTDHSLKQRMFDR